MPLGYLQLPGQDLNYDIVSLRGFYNGENGIVGKGLDEELDVDNWDNWMRWDTNEEPSDIPLDGFCFPDTSFSDFEFPEKGSASPSTPVHNGSTFQGGPFDDDNESLSFSPISYTGSMLLPEADLYHGLAVDFLPASCKREEPSILHQVSNSRHPGTTVETQAARHSRLLQIDTATRTARKRRAEASEPDKTCISKKICHNAIEKRYRTNLNDKISCLRDALPFPCQPGTDTKTGEEDSEEEDIGNKNDQQKTGKAAILTRALAYIQHLETNTQKLGTEMENLKSRIRAFERLVMSGSDLKEDELKSVSVRGTTLQSIQEEFTQFQTNPRSRLRSTSDAALPRKRTKRQDEVC